MTAFVEVFFLDSTGHPIYDFTKGFEVELPILFTNSWTHEEYNFTVL